MLKDKEWRKFLPNFAAVSNKKIFTHIGRCEFFKAR